MGGLGNQMFQIFLVIAYCKKYQKKYYFSDKDRYDNHRKTYWNDFLSALQPVLVPDNQINSLRNIVENSARYFKYPDLGDDFKFFGYFQSPLYFQEYKEEILLELNIRNLQHSIPIPNIDFENTISMHFRIGDYKAIQNCHPVLTIDYYFQCLDFFKKDDTNYHILYFFEKHDEPEVMEKINILQTFFPTFTFSSLQEEKQDWEQMLIMSRCKHHIIANSTFSWWGAYLGIFPGKTLYPSIWFGEGLREKDICDLFPFDWVKI
jgi:hypothetical protein